MEEVPESDVEANAASAYLLFYARHDLLRAAALDFQRDVYPALLEAARAAEVAAAATSGGTEGNGERSEGALLSGRRESEAEAAAASFSKCVVQ